MPNRILRESICTSATIDHLTPLQEVIYYRLLVNVDDYGRFDARPKLLAARLFPLRNITEEDIEDALSALEAVNLIQRYHVRDGYYLQIVTWMKYQKIRNMRSKFPEPPLECNCYQLNANVSVIQSESESKSKYEYEYESESKDHEKPLTRICPEAANDEVPAGVNEQEVWLIARLAAQKIRLKESDRDELKQILRSGIPPCTLDRAWQAIMQHQAKSWKYVSKTLNTFISNAKYKGAENHEIDRRVYRKRDEAFSGSIADLDITV